MRFVKETTTQTLEVKQSKFIAYLIPYSEYDVTLEKLKNEHPKARHFVVAYRYLNQYNQIVEHSSDDGEPKGTSGKPTLMVLQGADIINSAVITVRYFGGTKLGTGGLVRAYSDAANLVLNEAILFEYKDEISKNTYFNYSDIGKVEYQCGESSIDIIDKVFEDKVLYKIKGTKKNLDELFSKLLEITNIDFINIK
ncbi:MAG: YigZ family protein [Campylobacterales bacterium]|nr:YigZ family protein [Campylobacterales bacterium]